jgi:acyl-CoA reductase-like NAD-dependent aldehyde dehydrogenase
MKGLMIGGVWVHGLRTFKVLNKHDNTLMSELVKATALDINSAIESARKAVSIMASLPTHQRAAILLKTANLIKRDKESIAKCLAAEAGKPIKYAIGETDRAVSTFTIASEECKRIHGETLALDAVKSGENHHGYWTRRPIGIVAAITPFNFPLNLVAHKIAPAVGAGNPFILKPASTTPLTAVKLVELLLEAGMPPEAVNLVCGSGTTVGPAILANKDVSKITFTGSALVGEEIIKGAGIRKVTLELGNNSPLIINDLSSDGELERVVDNAITGSFAYQGQVCISVQRIYIQSALYEKFLSLMVEKTGKLKTGDPLDPMTDIGPMISESEAVRVDQWIKAAVNDGAKLLCGGEKSGRYITPAILTNVNESMKIMKDEVFGPVASITSYDNYEDALELADSSDYGLQAGVYTNDLNKAFEAVKMLNYGGVIINDVPTFRVDQQPYGGNRQSGLGREGLRFAMEDMTNIQMVVFKKT